VWSVIRATLPALKASAYRDFIAILSQMGVQVQHSRTEFTFTFGERMVEFFALDDAQKIRSRKRAYLHLVEANEITHADFIQLLIRTSRRVFLDFNPDIPDIWIRTELEQRRATELGDVLTIVSTYRDNPFLTADEKREIEYLQRVDPELWKVFGTGEYGRLVGTVFPEPSIVAQFPSDVEIIYGGIDWGYATDPTAVVRVGMAAQTLFIDEVVYERGLVNSEIFDRLPKDILYVADSAEPKSIEDMRRLGLRIIPSVKGPDSIRAGIHRIREFSLVVTARSTNVLKEMRNYKYSADGEPIDAFNHAMDALRYVVQTKLKRNNTVGDSYPVSGYSNMVGRPVGSGRAVH
jgi:phage terminase large subunit